MRKKNLKIIKTPATQQIEIISESLKGTKSKCKLKHSTKFQGELKKTRKKCQVITEKKKN